MDEIFINENTQKDLRELVRVINESNFRIQLIVSTIINQSGASEKFVLSQDLTKLVREVNE